MTENDEGFVVVNTKTGEMTTDYLGDRLFMPTKDPQMQHFFL